MPRASLFPSPLPEVGDVIVVDDSLTARMVNVRALQKAAEELNVSLGYFQGRNAAETMDYVRRRIDRIILIFTDIVMPDMYGTEMLKHLVTSESVKIREKIGKIPRLLMSVDAEKTDFWSYLQDGFANGIFAKGLYAMNRSLAKNALELALLVQRGEIDPNLFALSVVNSDPELENSFLGKLTGNTWAVANFRQAVRNALVSPPFDSKLGMDLVNKLKAVSASIK